MQETPDCGVPPPSTEEFLRMVHGADPAPHPVPEPTPHADPGPALDCDECRGGGTVITAQGRHELCPACQSAAPRQGHDTPLTRTAAHVGTAPREESGRRAVIGCPVRSEPP